MDKTITCFLPWSDAGSVKTTVMSMRASGFVSRIFIVVPPDHREILQGVEADYLRSAGFTATDALKKMAAVTDTDYCRHLQQGISA